MAKARLIAALVLVAVALVVVLQNTQPVETRFLFVTVTMPRAALLALTMVAGIAIGILISLGFSARKARKGGE
jgi:uncharacterized integral membrane protein